MACDAALAVRTRKQRRGLVSDAARVCDGGQPAPGLARRSVCSGSIITCAAGLIGRGGMHMWLGIDVGGKVLQGLGSCLFPDLAVHMATGTAAQYSAVCPDGIVTGLRVLSRQDLALHMATGGVVVVHSHRTGRRVQRSVH